MASGRNSVGRSNDRTTVRPLHAIHLNAACERTEHVLPPSSAAAAARRRVIRVGRSVGRAPSGCDQNGDAGRMDAIKISPWHSKSRADYKLRERERQEEVRDGGKRETELKAAILVRELEARLPFVAVGHATLHLISTAGAGGKTSAGGRRREGGTCNLAKGGTANYGSRGREASGGEGAVFQN